MIQFLLGAIAMASLVAAMVFLRFYRKTHDHFFLYFAASFGLEALSRIYMSTIDPSNEAGTAVYLIRVAAYGLIVLAIVGKNLPRRP